MDQSKDGHGDSQKDAQKKPGLIKALWTKLGMDVGTLMIMIKGGCAPVIALALYQYEPFRNRFSTLGYLVAIASALSMPIVPRAKFLQTLVFNIIAICIGAAMALLILYSSVQARARTSVPQELDRPGASGARQAPAYNSSASAVSGIWLFFNIMFANALRFARPQLQVTGILYSIFANIACTYAPVYATMDQAFVFVEMLLEAFLSGFAISTVVHFVVFPMSSRQVMFKEFAGYISSLKACVTAQKVYLQSMEQIGMLIQTTDKKGKQSTPQELTANDLRTKLVALTILHAKIHGDISFAKREMAIGKLSANDILAVFSHLRSIFLPTIGLGSIIDIFSRVSQYQNWGITNETNSQTEDDPARKGTIADQEGWNEVMRALHDPFERTAESILEGLDHVMYTLEFSGKPKAQKKHVDHGASSTSQDIEADVVKQPGDLKYGKHLEERMQEFDETRKNALRAFCESKGIDMSKHDGTDIESADSPLRRLEDGKNRQQLYLILYMENLLQATARATLDLVHFADAKVEDGTMTKSKLILPGWKRMVKWLKACTAIEDASNDESLPDSAEAKFSHVKLGQAFAHRQDPEHLPPSNAFQKLGDGIRGISHILKSPEVTFGFRVACATMSIGIIDFLEPTQQFFIEQRLVWALIMVAISMTMTSGSGVFGFIARVIGTVFAMVICLVIWYIAGGRGIAGAVLPILYIVICLETYIIAKFPRFIIVGLITIVTQVLILGYELQANVIGPEALSSNGQEFYPIYLFAPYRLAAVAAGCFVAFIWTYFPYPLTARSALRNQLGKLIYLIANFYSCVHTTTRMRLAGNTEDPTDKSNPMRQLSKFRDALLGKQLALLAEVRQHADFIPWDFSLGGKFPREPYVRSIRTCQHLIDYIALMSYSTRCYIKDSDEPDHCRWLSDLQRVTSQISHSSQETTSILIMLSNSLITGSPLPPYLAPPPAYRFTARLNELDPDLLSMRHVTEPGYASFAVGQVAGGLVHDDIKQLLVDVKSLVGEIDFSFHIISTINDSESTLKPDSDVNSNGKGKKD